MGRGARRAGGGVALLALALAGGARAGSGGRGAGPLGAEEHSWTRTEWHKCARGPLPPPPCPPRRLREPASGEQQG